MKDKTADGVDIELGMLVYDNDLVPVQVVDIDHVTYQGVTWYRVTQWAPGTELHGKRRPIQDGGRLSKTFRNYYGQRFVAPSRVPEA